MRNLTKGRAAVIAAVLATIAVTAFALVSAGVGGSARASTVAYPRNETLYTSGSQWGPIQGFNPFLPYSATGTVGLAYETLFRYDPLKDMYIPWLAESGDWTRPHGYTLTIRSGIEWSDGQPLTAGDVAWNFGLGRFAAASWHHLYEQLKDVSASGSTVSLTFREKPRYAEWTTLLSHLPIVSPRQWDDAVTNDTLRTLSPFPVGTGPYVADESGYDASTQVVWMKNPNGWWASSAGIAPDPKPTYVIDLVNSPLTNDLEGLLSGVEDLNNNYLPGIQQRVQQGTLLTYYPSTPYMLSGSTSWLEPNTTHAPLDDAVFRKALAAAIDIDQIVDQVYAGLVLPASPTGLLPTWSRYIDPNAVAKYRFMHSTSTAVEMLRKAGYPTDASGMFENKDGSRIDLTISVPEGWTDWEAARDMIVDSAREAGIQLTVEVKDYSTWVADRNTGDFDLVIDNAYGLSDNPWTYWNGIYHLPIDTAGAGQTSSNFERYTDHAAWALVETLDRTPPSHTAEIEALNTKLQSLLMRDVPMIPLWYNAIWAQFSSRYWTGWPSSTGEPNAVPAMWRGYFELTGIDMIDHLQPVP